MKKEGHLRQNITLAEAVAFCIAQVIGTGIFLKPTAVLHHSGSTGMAIIIWIAAGLITMCTALTVAEVASYKPSIGGITSYIHEYNGQIPGFLSGWFFAILNNPGTLAANSIATATFISGVVTLGDTQLKILALVILWTLSCSQMFSVKGTMKMQMVGAVIQAAPILIVIILGFLHGGVGTEINMSLVGDITKPQVALGLALLGAMWVYDGWQATANLGEEMSNAKRDFPRAIVISLSFLIILYVLFNVVGFKLLNGNELMASNNIGASISTVIMGPAGQIVMATLMTLCSIFTMNAEVMQATRDVLFQARNNNIFGSRWIRHIHPKFNTPINAIVFQGCLSTILLLTGTFESISLLVIFFVWIFTLVALFDVFRLRRQHRLERSFSVPFYPIIPIIAIFGAVFMLVSSVISDPTRFIIGIVVILAGLPVYYICHKYIYKDWNRISK